jgi:hypothetical protein
MFIGHYAVALAAKRVAPRTSLGTLFLAAQFVDLLWPILLLMGLEYVRVDPGNTAYTPLDFSSYPISHSLEGALLWGLGFGFVYYAWKKDLKSSITIALCVLSHWVLDFITHRPDLPLSFSGRMKVGAGLWNSIPGTVAVESLLFIGGVWLYVKGTRSKDRIGSTGFWSLIGVLALISVANLFSPPPPDVKSIAIVSNFLWLFVVWAYWVDKHRKKTA